MPRAMTILSAVIFSVGTMGAGAHYYVWQQQAEHAKQQIEAAITKINADKPMISYASLTTSGYPNRIAVTIDNPKFSGRVDQWLQSLADLSSASHLDRAERQAAIDSLPEWITDTSINGRIILSSNLLADHYTITASGPITSTNQIAGFKESSTSEPQGDTHCDINLTHQDSAFDRLIKQFKQEAISYGQLSLLDCRFPATRYVSDTKEMLTASAGGSIRINASPESQPEKKLDVALTFKDMEVSEAGDKLMEMYMRTLAPELNYSNSWSIYGKQTIDLDFSYDGPKDLGQMAQNVPLNIALNKLSLHNAVYQTDISFLLKRNHDNGKQNARFTLNAKSTFSETYQAMLRDVVQEISKEILAHPQPELDLSRFTTESLTETLLPAVPNFASLGTLTQAVDVSFNGNENFTEGDAALTQLELSANPYGITGIGNAKLTSGQMAPNGKLDLECRQCAPMLDDMASYVSKLKQAVSTIDPTMMHGFPIDSAEIAKFKNFLGQLATQGDDGLWRFAIISDASTGPSINGKSMMDVMALYNQHMVAAQP